VSKGRFGEYLGRIVALSALDVAEILEEQSASGRRFGEVALAWGLCQPQDVWEAWAGQLAHGTPQIDLRSFGVDAQAAAQLPARLARRFGAVAVRKTGDTLVVATTEAGVARAMKRLGRVLRKKVRYVIAPPDQIAAAIDRYYPPPH
jgi:type IV pilus assembly protein PilB